MNYNIALAESELNKVLSALASFPFIEVVELIKNITGQMQAQTRALDLPLKATE